MTVRLVPLIFLMAAQFLSYICGLALLKLILEGLARLARIERKLNKQVVESS